MWWGACMKTHFGGSWVVFVSRSSPTRSGSRRSFYDALVNFSVVGLTWRFWSRICTSPCEKPLWESCGKLLLGTFAWTCIGPCENLFTSSGVFGWNPPKPLHTFIQGLVRRSCGNPLHFFFNEVFALRCWESSALAFVWKFCLWCSEEVRLKRSGKFPCKNVHKKSCSCDHV